MPSYIRLALIALVTAAAWSDLWTRRIPNWITVPGAVLGLILQTWYGGFRGTMTSLAGGALGLGIFVALYIAGGMGAGDVKLLSAVGFLVGPQAVILVFVLTGLLGGIAAIGLAASRGRLRETLGRTGALMFKVGRLRWQEVHEASAAKADSLRLPYGVVIAGGTLLSLVIIH